ETATRSGRTTLWSSWRTSGRRATCRSSPKSSASSSHSAAPTDSKSCRRPTSGAYANSSATGATPCRRSTSEPPLMSTSELAEGARVEVMHPQDLAAKYEVKVFDAPSAAEAAGYTLGRPLAPRHVWNRDSAASAILFDLIGKRKRGEVSDIALVLQVDSVTGAFKRDEG